MKGFFFIFLLLLRTIAHGQQILLLLTEDFELASNTFMFDTGTTGPWTTSGINRWVINDEYDGGGIYPNTPRQDSTSSVIGIIHGAPFSNYMHIHDELAVASGVSNANYNPSVASDRFAYTSQGLCTKGLVDVTLAFFYICDGSPTAYGQVYYSINGGAWIQTGASQYRNVLRWDYVEITDSAFSDVEDIRFGFRWVNDAGTPPGKVSFSLDEIFVAASPDTLNSPLMNILTVPDTVCPLSYAVLYWQLSQPLCDGRYDIQLSSASGLFYNPINLGYISITAATTYGGIGLVIPPTTLPGSCYKLRINRIDPPIFTGIESSCFVVIDCPNSIQTFAALVTTDPDTVCAKSVIDVPFYSYGVFNPNNIYTAQLSDDNGNFTVNDTTLAIDTSVLPYDTTLVITPRNVFTVINSKPDNITYGPSTNPSAPGMIAGLIPSVPEGCNYYIRVIASNPETIGTIAGPFCIKHCDITSNQTVDLKYCITDTTGVVDTISVNINEWDSIATYAPGNQFIVELISMMPPFSIVNTGGLGVEIDNASGTMIITIPNHVDLAAMGIVQGGYYMRVIADSSSTPWNMNGTLIRITIGAPADVPSKLVPDKTVYCSNEIASFLVSPYNPTSRYQVLSPSINYGLPLELNGPILRVSFPGLFEPLELIINVREISYGCYGAFSPLLSVYVLVMPEIEITGRDTVYSGDTISYFANQINSAAYHWTIDGGIIVNQIGEGVLVRFDSAGTHAISLTLVSECGIGNDTYSVVVVQLPPDTTHTGMNRIRKNEISIYPNPVYDYIVIYMPAQMHFNISITDNSGKTILEYLDFSANEKLDVSGFPSGIYFLKVEGDHGCSGYGKFVKMD